MSDKSTVHIGENSPEQIAYRLYHEIMRTEDKVPYRPTDGSEKQADRKYLLDLYSECIDAVRGHRTVKS